MLIPKSIVLTIKDSKLIAIILERGGCEYHYWLRNFITQKLGLREHNPYRKYIKQETR